MLILSFFVAVDKCKLPSIKFFSIWFLYKLLKSPKEILVKCLVIIFLKLSIHIFSFSNNFKTLFPTFLALESQFLIFNFNSFFHLSKSFRLYSFNDSSSEKLFSSNIN